MEALFLVLFSQIRKIKSGHVWQNAPVVFIAGVFALTITLFSYIRNGTS